MVKWQLFLRYFLDWNWPFFDAFPIFHSFLFPLSLNYRWVCCCCFSMCLFFFGHLRKNPKLDKRKYMSFHKRFCNVRLCWWWKCDADRKQKKKTADRLNLAKTANILNTHISLYLHKILSSSTQWTQYTNNENTNIMYVCL